MSACLDCSGQTPAWILLWWHVLHVANTGCIGGLWAKQVIFLSVTGPQADSRRAEEEGIPPPTTCRLRPQHLFSLGFPSFCLPYKFQTFQARNCMSHFLKNTLNTLNYPFTPSLCMHLCILCWICFSGEAWLVHRHGKRPGRMREWIPNSNTVLSSTALAEVVS